MKVVQKCTTFFFFLPICRSLILHDRWKYDILQTTYRKAAATENGRAAKLGPMDAPFRGQNALRGMFEAGWLLVSGRKSPALSHHPFCHCTLDLIPYAVVFGNVSVYSDYGKFDPYLFNTTGLQTHNKEKLFKEWGYTVDDARWLQAEIERQGRERYLSGQYELGKLNMFGQRINIRVTIPRKDGFGDISFVTGWMVKPNGQIKLNTPYGGK